MWRIRRAESAVLLPVAIALALVGVPAAAAGGSSSRPASIGGSRRMVIVAIPHITWQDLRNSQLPNLHHLMDDGAVGLMPVADPADPDPLRTWVALGAGARAVSPRQWQPPQPMPDGGIRVDIAAVNSANARSRTGAEAGRLGSQLHRLGLTTALIGEPDSFAAWLLMDSGGRVDRLLRPPMRILPAAGNRPPSVDLTPWGVALFASLVTSDVVVVDLSPALRLTAPTGGIPKREALRAADDLIGHALQWLSSTQGALAVICPQSSWSSDPTRDKHLAPLLFCQVNGSHGRGLLYSSRTRWRGIVTPADFAPTVAAWWDPTLSSPGTVEAAQALTVQEGSLADLDRLDRTLTHHYRWGFSAATLYIAYVVLLLAASVLIAVLRPRSLSRLQSAALALPIIPVALLAAHATGTTSLYVYLSAAFLIAAAVATAAARLSTPALSLAVAMLLGAAFMVVDLLSGSALLRSAAIAFPVWSSRFYGICNEYMGVLLGLTLVGTGALVQAAPRAAPLATGFQVLAALAIGVPFWGANWGGSFAAAVGLMCFWMLRRRPAFKLAFPAAVAALSAAIAIPALLDLLLPPGSPYHSHIGASAAALLRGDTAVLGEAIHRKLLLSIWVLTRTPWTFVVLVAAAVAFWALLRRGTAAAAQLARMHSLRAGVLSSVIAGATAMVVNDSGIVAGSGALAASYGALLLLAARPLQVQT